jgi:hypothetical protein
VRRPRDSIEDPGEGASPPQLGDGCSGAYRPLIDRDPRHRWGRAAWLTLYAFVAIQMAWTLRPFVADPQLATRFIRSSEIGNAYVEVAGLVWRFLQGLTPTGNPY